MEFGEVLEVYWGLGESFEGCFLESLAADKKETMSNQLKSARNIKPS